MKRLMLSLALAWALPAAAATPATAIDAFVPEGWTVAQRRDADLDGDRQADTVLLLVHDDAGLQQRRLLVLRAGAQSYSLAGRRELEDARQAPTLGIRRGVLIVENELGGESQPLNLRQRFRWEASSGRLRLIGIDISRYSRTNATDMTELSFNTLSGERVLTRTPLIDERPDGTPLPMEERSYGASRRVATRVPPPRWYMEDLQDPDQLLDDALGRKEP